MSSSMQRFALIVLQRDMHIEAGIKECVDGRNP
jgi:hypothetical protein